MKRKAVLAFAGIYLFLYFLNYLHPMSFGDDYLYSFIWQGKPMSEPISEDAVRVASFYDIFVSQWSHYYTWGGRTVAHILAQFFLWMGKGVFNFFNAFIGVVLVAEIYWCIHKGKVSLNFDARTVCWIFFALWAFTPGFSPVFLWLTAACNYLWTNTILLAFLIPYVHKYFSFSEKSGTSAFLMFLFGIIAGWTNENSVCWVILVLAVFILRNKNNIGIEKWMLAGLTGLMIGYAILIFAPGNAARLYVEQSGGSNWLNMEAFKQNFHMFLSIIFFQIFLWFFSIRAIISLKQMNICDEGIKKEMLLAKVLCFLAFAMTAIMFLSPGFPPRSGFSGTVALIITTGVLLRLQDEYGISLILPSAKTFLFYVGTLYFIMSSTVTFYVFYRMNIDMQNLLSYIKQSSTVVPEKVIEVAPLEETSRNVEVLSGFHIPGFELSKDENNWINMAVSRYYGVKGIRMIKKDDNILEKQDNDNKDIRDK